MGDLRWMRQNGLEAAIKKKAAAGTSIIGVCGGYHMLGYILEDSESVEEGGSMRGMELLPVDTVFEAQKVRTRKTGAVRPLEGIFSSLSGIEITGYEIHMGRTSLLPKPCPFPFWTEARVMALSIKTYWAAVSMACLTGSWERLLLECC